MLFWSHLAMHRGYSWLCTQESPLAVLRGPYGMLEIEPGMASCKANTLLAVLSLQPQDTHLNSCNISPALVYFERGFPMVLGP